MVALSFAPVSRLPVLSANTTASTTLSVRPMRDSGLLQVPGFEIEARLAPSRSESLQRDAHVCDERRVRESQPDNSLDRGGDT